jgi:site-specific DNA recombinase
MTMEWNLKSGTSDAFHEGGARIGRQSTMNLSVVGGADAELRRQAHRWWIEAADAAGIELSGFDPEAPLEQRLAWAPSMALDIATAYARYSSKRQHSIDDQVRAVVLFAGREGMYVPPELICVDEAAKGRRVRRDGLDRLKAILKSRRAKVLLVFKVSRLFRQASKGFDLIQQEVVEEGLRAVSVSQGIDTAEKRSWKSQLQLHGLMDDMLLDAIADHCREGLIGLFRRGYTTGALGVGYHAVEVPGAVPTNRGLPRTMPAVDAEVSERIRQHFEWIKAGMTVAEGARRWRQEKGPCDPRSTEGVMSDRSYRQLMSNARLTGRWEFGRKRNTWSSKRDYTLQVEQPDSEVHVRQCEELRIVSDELFFAVQAQLLSRHRDTSSRSEPRVRQLQDLVTDVFHCPHCLRRYHPCGESSRKMKCSGTDCPAPATVDRPRAVAAVCAKLIELLGTDRDLVDRIVAAAGRLDARGEEEVSREAAERVHQVEALSRRIEDLSELAGEGTEEDRKQFKARVRAAQAERTGVQLELARLKQAAGDRREVTGDEIHRAVGDFAEVLAEAAAGRLGEEAVYRASAVFRRLVGSKVWVEVGPRARRKRPEVRGTFTPALLDAAAEAVGIPALTSDAYSGPVTVWLRRPPMDARGAEVRRLHEEEGLSFVKIGRRLGTSSSPAFRAYHRYYEVSGEPAPPSRSKRGRHREPA